MDVPGCGGRRAKTKSFKGVENFLKRVAFNLGNSPSQTEVKIISCIPIDVSDLQQKIAFLEKQLEENLKCTTCQNRELSQKRYVNTALCETKYPPFATTGISCNALDMERGTNPCLINSSGRLNPSQDQLSFVARTSKKSKSAMDTNRYANILPYAFDSTAFTAGDIKPRHQRKNFFKKKKKFLRCKKNKNHYVYYAQTNGSPFQNYRPCERIAEQSAVMTRSYLSKMIQKQYRPKILGGNLSENSTFSSPVCRDTYTSQDENDNNHSESDFCSCCHGEYQNIDTRSSYNPQVFRASEIITHRYNDSSLYDLVPVKEKPAKGKKASDMKPKSVKPKIDINCWPEEVRTRLGTTKLQTYPYLSYQTVPLMTDNQARRSPKTNRREPKNIPRRKLEGIRNKNEDKADTSKSCYVNFDAPLTQSCFVSCSSNKHGSLHIVDEANENDTNIIYNTDINKRKARDTVNKSLGGKVPRRTDGDCITTIINNSECQTSASADMKDSNTSNERTEEALNQIRSILENVLHEVKGTPKFAIIHDSDKKDAVVQKGTSNSNVASAPQIKGPNASPATLENDVMSTKQSFKPFGIPTTLSSNMQSSRLLNSFTYSPYNMDPFIPSCSKQISCNQYYYPPLGLRCFQNFPLFIQGPSRRHMCATCYKHSGQLKSSNTVRRATTTATNTEDIKEHSKETDNLIREIYKSMALHMGLPTKDCACAPQETLKDKVIAPVKSTVKEPVKTYSSRPRQEVRKFSNVVHVVSELFRKKDMPITSDSRNTTASKSDSPYNMLNESKLESNDVSTRSHTADSVDVEILRRERLKKFLHQKQSRSEKAQREKQRVIQTSKVQKITTVSSVTETEVSYSESNTPVPSVPQQRPTKQVEQKEPKEKKGLFTKMFNSVKLFKPRDKKKVEKKKEKANKKVEPDIVEESSSDSDDYQTIYSQKLESRKHTPRSRNLSKRRTHSKISYKQPYTTEKSPERFICVPPYPPQNYPRQRTERGRVIFENKYYHPYSLPYSSASSQISPYYQTYEARHVAVEPSPSKLELMKAAMAKKNNEPKLPAKGFAWLKKHKLLNLRCVPQWKRLILEG